MRPSRFAPVALPLAMLPALAGCPATPNAATASPVQSNAPAMVRQPGNGGANAPRGWPYRPLRMRIHPLTRIGVDASSGDPVLETRVEFTDRDGDTSKCVGVITITIYTPAGMGVERREYTTVEWDMTDLDANALRFDEVTRCYLLRIVIDPSILPPQVEVECVYSDVDGRELHADRVVTIKTE